VEAGRPALPSKALAAYRIELQQVDMQFCSRKWELQQGPDLKLCCRIRIAAAAKLQQVYLLPDLLQQVNLLLLLIVFFLNLKLLLQNQVEVIKVSLNFDLVSSE
jgi:hypothetical protein